MIRDSVSLKDMRFYHPVNVSAAAEHQIALNESPGLPVLSGQILGYFRIFLSSDENINILCFMSYLIFRMRLKPDQHNPAVDLEKKRNCLTTQKTGVFLPLLGSVYQSECALQVLSLRSPTPHDLIYSCIHSWKRQEPVQWDERSSPDPQPPPYFPCYFYFYDNKKINS